MWLKKAGEDVTDESPIETVKQDNIRHKAIEYCERLNKDIDDYDIVLAIESMENAKTIGELKEAIEYAIVSLTILKKDVSPLKEAILNLDIPVQRYEKNELGYTNLLINKD